jgi:hypothetical protein
VWRHPDWLLKIVRRRLDFVVLSFDDSFDRWQTGDIVVLVGDRTALLGCRWRGCRRTRREPRRDR